MKRTLSSLTILFAGFLLAACNTTDLYTTPEGTVAITLGSNFSANASTDLFAQGVPYNPETGESGVTSGVLRVFADVPSCRLDDIQDAGDELFFTGDGSLTDESDAVTQTLTTNSPTATLFLPPGTYTFLVEAEDDLAVGTVCDENIANGAEVLVPLISRIDGANLKLSAPGEVAPNEIFDVFVEVTALGRPDLRVPASDYDVSYEVESERGNAEVIGESDLGIRLAAECGEIELIAYVSSNIFDISNDSPEVVSTTIALSTPCTDSTSVGVDLVPPFVSFTAGEQDDVLVINGEVSDMQSGVDRVEIYEGPVFLGEAFIETDDTPNTLYFEGGAFPDDDARLTALAYDNAGNESRAVVELSGNE